MKRSKDEKAWLFGVKELFRLHNYSKNMKYKIDTFSLEDKVDIWWEYVNNFISIREEEMNWDEFERLFKDKYLSERYYDDKAKELYELKMGSIIDDEYTSIFLEFLRYLPYLKEQKVEIQRFISGLP